MTPDAPTGELIDKVLDRARAHRTTGAGTMADAELFDRLADRLSTLSKELDEARGRLTISEKRHAETEKDACRWASRFDEAQKRAEAAEEALNAIRTRAKGSVLNGSFDMRFIVQTANAVFAALPPSKPETEQ